MPHNPRGLELTPDQCKRFRSIVTQETSPWSLLVAQVDPDGLALAMIMLSILRTLGVKANAYYGGSYDDPQNQHIRNLLGLERLIRPMHEMPDQGPVALLDSCKLKDARFEKPIEARRIKIIIDHHQPDDRLFRPWRYVQIVHCGAAATIGWNLAKALGITPDRRACTLAAVGIHSDTNKFRAPVTSLDDVNAYKEAFGRGDRAKIQACHQYRLPRRYFQLVSKTYGNIACIGPAVVSHPGRRMRRAQSGFISHYADRLLKFEDAELALVWCLTEDGLRASIRAVDAAYDLNRLIDVLFGKGQGGAKHGSGGAFIPLDKLAQLVRGFSEREFDDELIARCDRFIRRRLEEYFRKTAP